MPSSLEFFLDGPQLGPHPVSARLSLELKAASAGSATDVRET
jgi:hypothetical protein